MNGNGSCRACGAAIVWTITEAGHRMPVDPIPVGWPAGKVVVEQRGRELHSRVVSERPDAGELYVSHFATCEKRKRKAPPTPATGGAS